MRSHDSRMNAFASVAHRTSIRRLPVGTPWGRLRSWALWGVVATPGRVALRARDREELTAQLQQNRLPTSRRGSPPQRSQTNGSMHLFMKLARNRLCDRARRRCRTARQKDPSEAPRSGSAVNVARWVPSAGFLNLQPSMEAPIHAALAKWVHG